MTRMKFINPVKLLLILALVQLLIHQTSSQTVDLKLDYNGSCWLKAWTAVAECRKEFVDRLFGRDDNEKCCLYRILEDCANKKSMKMCGHFYVNATEEHLKKYRVMIDEPDCSKISTTSKECFWIIWENYVTCGLFLFVVMIILGYTVRWYFVQ